MKKAEFRFSDKSARASGITLVELMTTIAVSLIPISVVGILLVGGHRNWNKTYYSANKPLKVDAETAAIVFRSVGRQADRHDCDILSTAGTPISASQPGTQVVSGEGAEFRFWHALPPRGGPRSDSQSQSEAMPIAGPTNYYARFYLDTSNNTLNVDYGSYPYQSNRPVAKTRVLARNVAGLSFNQTTLNGVSQGCVRMDLMLSDPVDDETLTVMAAVLMRD